MTNPPMDDLLRNNRRRRFSRRRSRWKAWAIGLLLVGIAGVGYWLYQGADQEEVVSDTTQTALMEAKTGVEDSVKAARLPLKVKQSQQDFDQPARDEALTAEWTEGEQVTIRGKLKKNQSVFVALQDRNLQAWRHPQGRLGHRRGVQLPPQPPRRRRGQPRSTPDGTICPSSLIRPRPRISGRRPL